MSSPPELPSHIRRIVDEIETEIGEEPGYAESLIEGAGAYGTDGEGGHDNGRVEDAVRQILLEIGEAPDRQGLVGTPERVHRMYTELTAGYHVDPDRLINGAIFDIAYSEMVVVKDIPFYSLCEHHLLPFFGTAAVAYIPRGRVIGLSKIPRVVEMYARRLQIQERLTQQIAEFLQERARAAGRGRRHRGDPPVRGDARRAQARDDHDYLARPRAVPDARPDARRVLRPSRSPGAGPLTVDLGLRDKVVLITGAGGGSGPTVARAFADEGAIVALHHRSRTGSAARAEAAAGDIVAAGGRALAVNADLDSTDADRLDVRTRRERGRTRRRAGHGDVGLPIGAVRADRRRVVVGGRGRPVRRDVPDVPGGRTRDAGGRLGTDRQRRRTVRAGRDRSGHPLRRREGGHHRADRRRWPRSSDRTGSSSTRSRRPRS